MTNKTKTKYPVVVIATIIVLLIILISTFLPVSLKWTYGGENASNAKPIYIVKFYYFFLSIGTLLSSDVPFLFLNGIFAIAFYFFLGGSLLFLFVKKDMPAYIFMIGIAVCNIVNITSNSSITFFSIISLIVILILLLLNAIYNDSLFVTYKNKDLLAKKKKMIKIGSNIRKERICRNLTQEELAKMVFVSRSTIAKYESGVSFPSEEQIELICKSLQIEKNKIIDEK